MKLRLKKNVSYKSGLRLQKGSVVEADAGLDGSFTRDSPVLDKARSHPKVWGEYRWVDEPQYTFTATTMSVRDGKPVTGHYGIAAKDVEVVG